MVPHSQSTHLTGSPDFYASLIQSLREGVVAVDRSLTITLWNHALEQLTGYGESQMLGQSATSKTLQPLDREGRPQDAAELPLARALSHAESRDAREYLKHSCGYRFPVETRTFPVRDSDGRIRGAAQTFQAKLNRWYAPPSAAPDEVDPASGVLARGYGEQRLNSILQASRHFRRRRGLYLIHVAELTQLERRFGMDAEQAAISVCGQTLQHCAEADDILVRWNRAWFLCLAPLADAGDLNVIRDRMQNVLSATSFPWWGDPVPLTVKVGAVLVQVDRSLLEQAAEAKALAESES